MGDANDLHDHLKNLVENSSIPWTYGIVWECSFKRRVLRFKDGYHRRSGKGNPKQVRIMGSCITVTEDATDDDDEDDVVASEWFFKISMNQSFEFNEDLPGQALIASVWINAQDRDANPMYKWGMWERTKWAHQFGIRTFHCFPFLGKSVLELASTQIIPYFIEPVQRNSLLIHPVGTLTRQQQQQLRRIGDDANELNEEADEEAVNEMKNRGKEKISDSKCSWTILTESSDRGTDRTFSCSHDYSGPS